MGRLTDMIQNNDKESISDWFKQADKTDETENENE